MYGITYVFATTPYVTSRTTAQHRKAHNIAHKYRSAQHRMHSRHIHQITMCNSGPFTATCFRELAPVWVDRIYNLAANGYYDENYFLRVVNTSRLKIVQFGTNGDPFNSKVYNW
jgi:cyclophilin family peptidyl-prolyl cis-trans isomerase